MWLFTRYGFFSVSCPNWDKNQLQVRARACKHLASLQGRFPRLKSFKIQETIDADYRYRIVLPRQVWTETVTELVLEQTWSNFKNEANSSQRDAVYDNALHEIWTIMYSAGKEWQKENLKAT